MMQLQPTSPTKQPSIEIRINKTGSELIDTLGRVLDAVPDQPQGPQALAKRIHIDKVLASRVLRAVRSPDAMSAMHRIPGPEPLRKLLKAAAKQGVSAAVIKPAEEAVTRFAGLIRDDLGDRGALDAIVSAWVPEARKEFELRRKQSAYKAMSQLKGSQADAILATAIISVAEDTNYLDLIWVSGLFGLQRLRPGASVKLATRRMTTTGQQRIPRTLDGTEIQSMPDSMVAEFTSEPKPTMDVHHVGEVVHYTLGGNGFGPNFTQDMVIAEVNRGELPRYIGPDEQREAFMFAEVSSPTKVLQFDTIVHNDVYPNSDPRLYLYDTAFEGVADINDRTRDIDRLDMLESIERLGQNVVRIGSSTVPHYGQLIRHVCERMNWNPGDFRAYRCHIDYPVYGSQVVMSFDVPRRNA